jgi:hypothetical protein
MNLQQLRSFVNTAKKKGYVTASVAKQTHNGIDKIEKISSEDNEPVKLDSNGAIEEYFSRFMTKHPDELTSDSANVYASRVRKAVENCRLYNQDPLKYQPTFGTKRRSKKVNGKPKPGKREKDSLNVAESTPLIEGTSDSFDTVYPLRQDYLLPLTLPRDLETQEVRRLAYYLLTVCKDFNPGKGDVWYHQGPEQQKELPRH